MGTLPIALTATLLAACAHTGESTATPFSQELLAGGDSLTVRLQVEAARREVVVLAGPFHVPAAVDTDEHAGRTPLIEFDWPVEGWIRGFRISVFDADRRELPRDLMHHLIGYNFSRRQLIHPGVERLFGIGAETPDIVLPARVGVPVPAGSRLGFDAVWHNATAAAVRGVYLRVALVYTPARAQPIALEAFPIHVDVNYSVAGSNEFDIPPGRSERRVEFSLPISGSVIGVGGHLHEHGVALRLEDAETDQTLFTLRALPQAGGRVGVRPKVFRKWLGLRDARLRLEAGHRYRLVGVYDNATGELIPRGAMAHIAGLFRPDDAAAWPQLDPTNPEIQEDLALLRGEKPRHPARSHHH